MNPYNGALRARQESGEAGLAPVTYPEQRRDAMVLGGVFLLGLALAYASPLPGLGSFLIAGAVMASPVFALHIWLGRLP